MNRSYELKNRGLRLYKWIKKNRQDIWIVVFTVIVFYTLYTQKQSQIEGRRNRITQDNKLRESQKVQNNNLRLGEILVCTKSLGALNGVLHLAVPASRYKTLSKPQQDLINQYFSIADPKQCSKLINITAPKPKGKK